MIRRRSLIKAALATPFILCRPALALPAPIKNGVSNVSRSVMVGLHQRQLGADRRVLDVLSKYSASRGLISLRHSIADEWLIADDRAVPDFIADLKATGLVRYAERNLMQTGTLPVLCSGSSGSAPCLPNDPRVGTSSSSQWFIAGNTGSIGLDIAWGLLNGINTSLTYGSSAVKLADINSGYGQSGYTTDAIVNQLTGWNVPLASTNTFDVSAQTGCAAGHGTSCANIMMGHDSNGVDIAGVAGGCSYIPIIDLTFLSCGNYSFSSAWLAAAIDQLITLGANAATITNSLGQSVGGTAAVQTALIAAYNAGVFIVGVSGDDGATAAGAFPCKNSLMFCVGGSDINGSVPNYSTFGPGNFVAAVSTGGGDVAGNGLMPFVGADGVFYAVSVGTSYSGPVCCGVAGLVMSANSALIGNPGAIADILIATAVPHPGVTPYVNTFQKQGYGLINAGAAVQMAINGSWPNNQRMLTGVN